MLSVTDVRPQFYLGVQGENGEHPITVDVKPWLASYPNGVVSIWHTRNGDSVPSQTGAVFDAEAGTITWTPTYTDTFVAGEGEAEIRLYENGVIKKTRKIRTGVSPSVTGSAGVTLESGWQGYINYIDDMVEDAQDAQDAAEDAQEAAETAQTAAETAQGLAEAAQTAAETAQGLAETAQTAAESAQTAAETAQGKAEDAQTAAETAQGKAEDAQAAAETAQGKAEDAQEAAEAAAATYPYIDEESGNWMVYDADEGEYVDTGIHAQGPAGTDGQNGTNGQDGQDGQDGYSPTASVSKSGSTSTITITDKNGTTTATISDGTNGTNGTNGQDGQDGQDGYSPTASVSKSGSTATISITDKNGTTTAQITDGTNGTNGQDGVGVPAGGSAGQVLAKSSGTDYATEWVTPHPVQTVSGSTPSITGVAGTRYICGECSTLSIVAPASGIIDVVFQSGTTATVLTVTSTKSGVTAIKWANSFDATSLDASTTYELNILDGEYGVAGKWT